MYPAAQQSGALIVSVALVFGTVTLATMLAAVVITSKALHQLKLPASGRRFTHAIAGASVALCGGAISLLGL